MSGTAEPVVDPVHGTRYEFERRGDDLFVRTWMEPGGALPKHYHPVQEEAWFAIEGEMEAFVDGTWHTMRPEDGKAVVKPGVVHAIRNTSGEPIHLGCDVSPALNLEEFLTDSARAAREGLFMKGGIPKSWRGAKWAAGFLVRHEDQTVMTFPPRFVQKMMRPLA